MKMVNEEDFPLKQVPSSGPWWFATIATILVIIFNRSLLHQLALISTTIMAGVPSGEVSRPTDRSCSSQRL